MKFVRLTDFKKVDVKEYVTDYLIENSGVSVYVGCDSQRASAGYLKYATVIVLYKQGKGGHVLFNAERVKPIKDIKMRILGEVQRSIDVAQYLRDEVGIEVNSIELDINEDKKFRSNSALSEAIGYATGMGFKAKWKPADLWSIRAANTLCR